MLESMLDTRLAPMNLAIVKQIIKYCNGTFEFGILYLGDTTTELVGYSDAEWLRGNDDKNSTLEGCFYLSNSLISWHNKKQSSMPLSPIEVEYIIVGLCCS